MHAYCEARRGVTRLIHEQFGLQMEMQALREENRQLRAALQAANAAEEPTCATAHSPLEAVAVDGDAPPPNPAGPDAKLPPADISHQVARTPILESSGTTTTCPVTREASGEPLAQVSVHPVGT